MGRESNIPAPPSENPQLDQPSPEDRPVAYDDRMDMIGSGLAALAMTYTGLRSFEQNASLFGKYGEAAAQPIQGVKEFVQEGIRRYKEGDGSVSAKVRAMTLSDADEKDRLEISQRASDHASDNIETQRNIRSLAQTMAEQKANKAIDGRPAERVAEAIQGTADRAQATENRARQQSLGAFEDSVQSRADKVGGPDFKITEQSNRAAAELARGRNVTPASLTHKQRALKQMTERDSLKGRIEDPAASNTALRVAQERDDAILRDAWEQFRKMHSAQNLTRASEMTLNQLRSKMAVHNSYERIVQNMREGPSEDQATSYNSLFQRVGMQDQGEPQPSIKIGNVMAGDSPAGQADINAIAGQYASGLDPTEDILDHRRDLEASNRQLLGEDDMRLRLSTAGGEGAPTAPMLKQMRKGSTADKLAAQVFERFEWGIERVNAKVDHTERGQFEFTMEKVRVDENHHIYKGTVSKEDGPKIGDFKIPLPSAQGSFRKNTEERPFAHPLQKMIGGDFFEDTPMRSTIHSRGTTERAMAAGPHEMALARSGQYVEKFINDLVGGREEGALDFIQQRIIDDAFEAKSKVKNPQQGMIKALESRHSAESLFKEAKTNPTRRQQFEAGLRELQNLRRLHNNGERFFAADSEFVSPETVGEAGTTGSAKTPFEVAGAVVDPNKDVSQADILYRMDLSDASGQRKERTKEEIQRIYEDISNKDTDEAEELLERMEKGGELKVSQDGQTYDLLNRDEDLPGRRAAQDALDWIPEKGPEESTAQYYMKVQNAMLEEHGAGYAVGQNFKSSEGVVFGNLSNQTGVELDESLDPRNTVDTMHLAHLFNPNQDGSKSLQSISAAAYDLDYKQYRETIDEFENFYSEAGQELQRHAGSPTEVKRRLYENVEPQITPNAKKELARGRSQEDIVRETKGKKRLLGRLAEIAHEMPEDLDAHTARFDAFVTGRVGLPKLRQWAAGSAGAQTEDMMEDLLFHLDEFAGERHFVEAHGAQQYGGFREDGERQDGPIPYFSNQASAAMGRGVLARPRLLPFYRLQNPVRQLYQRAKPNRLMNAPKEVQETRGDMVQTKDGGYMPTRQRMGRERQLDTYRKRMNVFRNNKEGAPSPTLDTSSNAPMLFAGAGSATPKQRKVYGGYENEMQYAVTNRVAYLPNDHNRIYESRSQSTAARRDALMETNVFNRSVSIDTQQINKDNAAGSQSMDEWIQNATDKAGITLHDPEAEPQKRAMQDDNLKEAYQMAMIRKDPDTQLSERAKTVIDSSIRDRLQRANGSAEMDPREFRQKALYEARSGKSDLNVDRNERLLSPTSDRAIVKDPLLMQGHKRMVGVQASIRRNDTDPDELVMEFIEDPGQVTKEMTAGAKGGTQGIARSPAVGMAGEQAIMEAPFMKSKRRDFAGYPRAQIERMYNQAVEELQKEARSKGPFDTDRRERILDRFAGSLSKMSGMSQSKIRSEVVDEKLPTGGSETGFADFFRINYTDEFTRAVEDNASTTRMMNAAKNMGLTTENVFKQGSQMLQQHGMDAKKAEEEMAKKMSNQLEQEIDKLRKLGDEDYQQKYFDDEFELTAKGPDDHDYKQEIKNTIGRLREKKERVDELYKHPESGTKISDLNDGALFDFFVDSEDGSISMAFRALATSFHMQNPATGGTSLGNKFERGSGRATLDSRSSMLTSALIGHSASTTVGALGGQQQAAYEVFQGWLASKSGAAAFSNSNFQQEVVRALSQQGLDYTDVFDPEKVEATEDGYAYVKEDGTRVALEKHVRERFDWNAQEGSLQVRLEDGTTKSLSINPFSSLRETIRKQAGVVGMVTGELQGTEETGGLPVGSQDRTLELVFGDADTELKEGRVSADDFHQLFGKKTRAQQYHQHKKQSEPSPAQERSFNKNKVFFGEDARPKTTAGDDTIAPDVNYNNTVFNEQFDFLEVDLFGGLSSDQTEMMVQNLKKSGVSEDQLARMLMGDQAIMQAFNDALDDEDLAGTQELKRVINFMREGNQTGSPSIYVPTKTGAEQARAPYEGDDVRSANVPQWAQLADRVGGEDGFEAIEQIRNSVQRIHARAKQIDTSTRSGQQELRNVFESELEDVVDSGAFSEVQDLFSSSLRHGANSLMKQMKEAKGTYLGGEYKVSATQTDMLGRFKNLLPKTTLGEEGPGEAFRQEVKYMMEGAQPDMKAEQPDEFAKRVDKVSGELHQYMQQQMQRLEEQGFDPEDPDEMFRWRGFGVGEGFMGRSKAKQVLGSMEASHRGWDKTAGGINTVREPTNSQAERKEKLRTAVEEGRVDETKTRSLNRMADAVNLEKVETDGAQEADIDRDGRLQPLAVQQASARERAVVRQEVRKPGSTPGVIMSTIRQPDFQVSGGYEMSRLSVLGDMAMRAVGADPEQLHMFSHPLASWSRKEDYDFDLNFMAAIDDTVSAHIMRETRANSMPQHLVNLFQMQENVAQSPFKAGEFQQLNEGESEMNIDRFYNEVDEVQLDTGQTVSSDRVVTPFDAGEDVFEKSVGQFFGAEGLAKEAVAGDDAARRSYALQKAVVGQFGAYAKQGAIKTRQRQNAFMDTMQRLVKERDRMAEKMADERGLSKTKSTKKANQVFSKMFKRDLPDVQREGEVGDAWKKMEQTYNKVNEIRDAKSDAPFDRLHMAALTEAEITQTVAIEKYKYGDPEQVSRRVSNIFQSLHGNLSGPHDSFEQAWSALMKESNENMPFPVHQMFGNPEQSVEKRRQLAKDAFRTQFEMNQAMKSAGSAGIGGSYLRDFANVPSSDIPPQQKLASAMDEALSRQSGEALQSYAAQAASRAFRNDSLDERMREFAGVEHYRESRLEEALSGPATTRESFDNMLERMPIGAKAAGAVGAAALAVAAAAPGPREGTGMGSEEYDTPQRPNPRNTIGSRQSGRQLMQLREGAQRQASFMRVSGGAATGQQYGPSRPPTRRADY